MIRLSTMARILLMSSSTRIASGPGALGSRGGNHKGSPYSAPEEEFSSMAQNDTRSHDSSNCAERACLRRPALFMLVATCGIDECLVVGGVHWASGGRRERQRPQAENVRREQICR